MKPQHSLHLSLAVLLLFSFTFLLPGQTAVAQDPPPLFPAAYLPAVLNQIAPSSPVLEPVTGAEDGSYTLFWSASTYGEPTAYIVQEAANAAFTQNVREACNTPELSCEITGKTAGTLYYRVRGINEYGPGNWSSTQSAAVLLPGTPALSGIDNNDFDRSYTLNWTAAALATIYRLQQSSDNAFTNPTELSVAPDTSFTLLDQPDGIYYYRVRAEGPTGVSPWSSIRAVAVLPPPAPALSAIANGDFDRNYTITWQNVARAASYTLEQSTDSAFTNPSVLYTGLNTTFSINNQGAGSYYYRVRAENPVGTGPWSGVQSVTILAPPAPVLSAINNGDFDRNYTVTWQSAARAVSYILEQSTNSAFSDRTTVYNGPGTTWSMSTQSIGTYYYRVRGENPVGPGSWSTAQSVQIKLNPPVLSAINNADNNNFYKLSWSAAGSGVTYIVEEASNYAFTGARTVYKGSGTTWLAADRPYGRFYYRVKATYAGQDTTWSNTQSANVPTPPAGVTVLNNHAVYMDSSYLNVTGEIYNNTANHLMMVKVTVKFFKNGTVVASGENYTNILRVRAYEKAPFAIEVSKPQAWDSYRFEPVSYLTTPVAPPKLTVYNTSTFDNYGMLGITGKVRNDDTVLVMGSSVHATLFDENGKILDMTYKYVNTLAPGETKDFYLESDYPDRPRIAYIRYQTDGIKQ